MVMIVWSPGIDISGTLGLVIFRSFRTTNGKGHNDASQFSFSVLFQPWHKGYEKPLNPTQRTLLSPSFPSAQHHTHRGHMSDSREPPWRAGTINLLWRPCLLPWGACASLPWEILTPCNFSFRGAGRLGFITCVRCWVSPLVQHPEG